MAATDQNHVIVLAIVEDSMSVTEAATRFNLSPAVCGRNVRIAGCTARSTRGCRHHGPISDMNVTTAHSDDTQRANAGWQEQRADTLETTKATEPDGPAAYDTAMTAEEGLWARKGWAGQSR